MINKKPKSHWMNVVGGCENYCVVPLSAIDAREHDGKVAHDARLAMREESTSLRVLAQAKS